MRVSIIIPALNEAETIGQTIDYAWKAGAHEVIAVDGGSDDETRQIAGVGNCLLVTASPGRGLQQNEGAKHAQGDVLLFQHADNWLEPGAVDQIRRALEEPARLGGAFRQRIEAAGVAFRLLEWGNALRVRFRGLPYGDQGIFLRRETFVALGGFPEVPLMEDVILSRRFRRVAWPVLLPGPIHVNARRWRRYGVVHQTLRNWLLLAGFRLGIPSERLAKRYARHDLWERKEGPSEKSRRGASDRS